MRVDIRRVDERDAAKLLALRRVALTVAPGSLASSPEGDRISDIDAARRILGDTASQAVFGAFDPHLIGMVGIRRESSTKLAHRAYVWGMFMHPQERSEGWGRRLMQAAIQRAGDLKGIEWLDLSVSEDAPEACALHRSLGFEVWGQQLDALREGGRQLSELYCALRVADSA